MLKDKIYIWLIMGLLFGVCLGVPLGHGSSFTIGINHWTENVDDGFLFPTNESHNVSLNNNSLLWSNLSSYAGENITWLNDQFHVSANGTSKWTLVGSMLYTKIDGNDVQINGTLNATENVTIGDTMTFTNSSTDHHMDVYLDENGVLVWKWD